jgi:hypothetical protein
LKFMEFLSLDKFRFVCYNKFYKNVRNYKSICVDNLKWQIVKGR